MKMPYSVLSSLLESLWSGRTAKDLRENADKILKVQTYIIATGGWDEGEFFLETFRRVNANS